jgi:hypothetical protein
MYNILDLSQHRLITADHANIYATTASRRLNGRTLGRRQVQASYVFESISSVACINITISQQQPPPSIVTEHIKRNVLLTSDMDTLVIFDFLFTPGVFFRLT